MRVLVGNNAMGNPGGSETHAYALIKELVERGHQVSCITKRTGMVSKEVEKLGVKSYSQNLHGKFDLALLSHSTSIALSRNVKAFKVQTCHGIYPTLEQPVKGMDNYVSISEEVQTHLKSKKVNSTIIRNGIDCERFKPTKPINKELKTILSLSHSDEVNHLLEWTLALINVELIIHNKYKTPIWNVEDKINEVDLVVSLGRGAYEAMACGRNVLILDNRKYANKGIIGDGLLTPLTIPYYSRNNCSGRFSKHQFNQDILLNVLSKYKLNYGKKLRQFALKNLNIKTQVDKYLALVR